ncbi:cation diffusion facilitator family transporter [Heliobacterium gestii]|uniref:Cation diffusion facilitator family transporter n=1 Tax=Heliomicrobium gestii TaxID=2699 RepID=A0A845LC11_HELGE|nr:cation diffusion facilitator family transporter [Heliomicrobium gestii]MBM7867454.1 cation diffusion facilitator family transporter [Heliomicrobium gestii]MZP43718.1 cation diffusion facilitator family transporter [Heliomicrobium gestii]
MGKQAVALLKQANYTALQSALGNYLLAVLKWAAFVATGSPAMQAEAVHSFNDGSAQAAVFTGSVFAARKPTSTFPNGFGRLSNLIVLFVALFMAYNAFRTVQTSYGAMLNPHPVSGYWWNMAVLLASLCVDGFVLYQAMRDIGREAESDARGLALIRLSFSKYHLASPETRLVFFEDLLATAAIVIASSGITASHLGIAPWGDGLAGAAIGVLLFGIALKVAWDNAKGLIGYTAPEEVVDEIGDAIMEVDGVEDLYELDVVQEGSFLDVDGTIELPEDMSVAEAEDVKYEIQRRLKKIYPNIHNLTLSVHEDDALSRWGSREYGRLRRKVNPVPAKAGDESDMHNVQPLPKGARSSRTTGAKVTRVARALGVKASPTTGAKVAPTSANASAAAICDNQGDNAAAS